MNYIDDVTGRLAEQLPDCDTDLLRMYALLTLTVGTRCTNEHVHDAWSAWRTTTRPDHPSIVPYAQLAPEVQELDSKYAAAIREVAGPARPTMSASVPTFEERIIGARQHLSSALGELTSAGCGYYTGDDPTDRQDEALRDGMRKVRIARNTLTPGTHRQHVENAEVGS